MFRFLLGLSAAMLATAQTALPPTAAQIRARMDESLRKQSESVARQLKSVRAAQPLEQPPALAASVSRRAPLRPVLGTLRVCDSLSPGSFDPQIKAEADRQGVAPELLRAVISTESAFVPCAVSDKGAMGLMQLMPATAQAMGVLDPMDPADNLRGGVRYLGQLLERYGGDLTLALSAYNAGPGLVDKYGGIPPIPATQKYVRDILKKINAKPPVEPEQ